MLALNSYELKESNRRIISDAFDHLAVGPMHVLLGGSLTVFSLGLFEARLCLRPPIDHTLNSTESALRRRFMLRYAISQIIPSVVWDTVPATRVAQTHKIPESMIWGPAENKPSSLFLMKSRLTALRGVLAGSIILSQVVSLTDVVIQAKADYSKRIQEGREPPLDDPTQSGVVLRLAGEESDTTNLSLLRYSRRKIFPIYELPERSSVQQLVRQFGFGSIHEKLPTVPIFWHIDDGRYSNADSWHKMKIPKHWLFDVKKSSTVDSEAPDKVLILEADATSGMSDSISLDRPDAQDLDLDLYEVAQGFHKLQQIVDKDAPKHSVSRVLLVDTEARVVSGGGRETKAGNYIQELALSDIVINSRAILVWAILCWLNAAIKKPVLRRKYWGFGDKKQVVILETPVQAWFINIQTELSELGYDVMDRSDALNEFGTIDDIPVLVYEKSTADTVHTCRQMAIQNIAKPALICALCGTHEGIDDLKKFHLAAITSICSSDLYDRSLEWVRHKICEGMEATEIQSILDNDIALVLGYEQSSL